MISHQKIQLNAASKRIQELEEKQTILADALKWYADHKNWMLEPAADISIRTLPDDYRRVETYSGCCGGKIAYMALKKAGIE